MNLYFLNLLVILQAVYLITLANAHLQQVALVCTLCYVARHARRNKATRRPPAVYVRARSRAWTEIVLRPDLFEEARFRFFFRITRERFEVILQGVGGMLRGSDTQMKNAV
jgi:hypothetical protein